MDYRRMGNSDIFLSEVSLGCWVMGGDYWGGADDNDSIGAIIEAVENGVNFIDTAEIYGRGRSEEIVGKALKGRRSKAVISSKVWKTHMRYDDVKKACEDSLRRMQTDYIDVYFIHYPNDEVDIGETMSAMLDLKKEGKIREIGLSNFSMTQMEEALKAGRYEVIQPCYSLLWRFIEEDIVPYCIENNIGIVAYSPIAQGILTGKFTKDWEFKTGDNRKSTPLFQPGLFEECLSVADALKPYAQRHGKTQGQVAINWVTSQPGITSAIVGARNAAQMKENMGAAGWRLSRQELAEIDKIGRRVTDRLPRYENFFSTRIID
ncbi:MAG TPA: aldo/keto reductase [Clostridiaceae bacterium]|nr:aldo/keto reductase [Clostridiaceae bacterium]